MLSIVSGTMIYADLFLVDYMLFTKGFSMVYKLILDGCSADSDTVQQVSAG